MPSYNVHEAKNNLSKLLKEAAQGRQVIIMRNGKPVARLIPIKEKPRKKIKLGFAAGQVTETPGVGESHDRRRGRRPLRRQVLTYLLDSHTFLWAVQAPEKLSRKARRICEQSRVPLRNQRGIDLGTGYQKRSRAVVNPEF